MPRAKPHFKVFTTIRNHRKFAAYADNDALALWLRLGVEAIERFADRTDDSFILHQRELLSMTGARQLSKAIKVLDKLCQSSPITYSKFKGNSLGTFLIHFPNLAKKHGFKHATGGERSPNADADADADVVQPKGPPSEPAAPRGSAHRKRKEKKPIDPRYVKLAEVWADRRWQTMETPRPTNPRVWANAIRLIVERDGYPLNVLDLMVWWLYSPTGNLASSNGFRFECHSPVQARKNEKLPAIKAAMQREAKPVGRESNYVPPPPAFSKPEGFTRVEDLSEADLEQAAKDTAAAREKLSRGGQNGAGATISASGSSRTEETL